MSAEFSLDFGGEYRPLMRQRLQLIEGDAASLEGPRILFGGEATIPEECEEEWKLINKELSLAIELRDIASRKYEAVRMARLALASAGVPNSALSGGDGLEILQDELCEAEQRLHNAIAARIELTTYMRQ